MIFTSDDSMPRSRNTIGRYVEQLHQHLYEFRGDDAFLGRVHWL